MGLVAVIPLLTTRSLPTRGLPGQPARLALPGQVVPPGSWNAEKAHFKHYKVTDTPASAPTTSTAPWRF